MKTKLLLLSVALAGAWVWAAEEEVVALPPQEPAPFRVVIEEVPETAPGGPAPEESADAPVAEGDEEAAQENQRAAEGAAGASADEEEEEAVQLNCGHALTPPKAYDTEVLMLQIFLDRHNFSCGVIDGVWGGGSREAMQAWQRAAGMKRCTPWVDVPLYGLLAEMPDPLVKYVISAEDVALVTGPMPPTWAERAQLRVMGYETLGACVAERFHTSERTLRRLNPNILRWPEDLAQGTVLLVPNVRQAALEMPASLAISLEECVLAGYNAQGKMCVRFPCSIARNKAHLPKEGELKVVNMAPAPNYTYDPKNYGQDPSVGKMIVPPGPRNPVGSRWIGLSLPGYGIHGTPKPNTVGRPESRGCFRLTNWNAEKLFELVKPGTPLRVVRRLSEFRPPVAAAAKEAEAPVKRPSRTVQYVPKAEDAPAPKAEKPAPKVEEAPAPKAEKPAPKVEEAPAPKVEKPAPKAEKPAPKVEVPVPQVEAPAPKAEEASGEVEADPEAVAAALRAMGIGTGDEAEDVAEGEEGE